MPTVAAEAWFIAGTAVCIAAGALHVAQTLRDAVHPRSFAPIEPSVKQAMEGTGMRFRRAFRGDHERPSMWSAWLGFNVSHGLGVFVFGLLCLVIAIDDYGLVERIEALEALTIAVPATYLAVSLRFWFYVPVIITGSATACFTVAAVLSA